MEEKKIVTEPSEIIRSLARQALRGCWRTTALSVFLWFVLLLVPMICLMIFMGTHQMALPIVYAYYFMVAPPLLMGLVMVFLNVWRKRPTSPFAVFQGFELLWKAICLFLAMYLFIWLWSLLFIIPGIIAMFRYCLAPLILIDNPEKGIFQCINESKYLMSGNKAKAFCLYFSFIGWSLLTAAPLWVAMMITFSSMASMAQMTAMAVVFYMITMIAFFVGYGVLLSYMGVSYCCFYDMVIGNLTVRRIEVEGSASQGTDNSDTTIDQGATAKWQTANVPETAQAAGDLESVSSTEFVSDAESIPDLEFIADVENVLTTDLNDVVTQDAESTLREKQRDSQEGQEQ